MWSHVWYSDTLKPRQLCTFICFGQPSNSSAVFMTKLHATVWADICLNFWEEWRRNELTGRGGACVNSSIQVLWNWVHNTLQCVNSSIHVLRNWVHNTCKDGPLWVPWGNFYRTQVSLVPGSLCPSVRKWDTFVRLNWCDSGWWRYQLNTTDNANRAIQVNVATNWLYLVDKLYKLYKL